MPVPTTGNSQFAECKGVCRVQSFEHSTKKLFTECCSKNTRQNSCTRQKRGFAECEKKTLGKERGLPSAKKILGKEGGLTSVFLALGKEISFFSLLTLKLFLLCTYNMCYSMLKFGIFLNQFAIFN